MKTGHGLVLDLGCGGSIEFPDVWQRDAIGVDIRPSNRKNFVQANIEEKLPFEDGSVSHVYLYDVIEHLDSPGRALKEILRVLEPGGELEIGTPNAVYAPRWVMSAFRGTYGSFYDHVQVYGKPELEHALKRAGYSEIEVRAETYREDKALPFWHRVVVALMPFPSLKARQLRATARKPI